mgnify:FL=1
MYPDADGFLYPKIDNEKCVNCNKCKAICPVQPRAVTGLSGNPIVYAAYALDHDIVEHSSSGGVFSILSTYVINNGGVVFGAAFDTPDIVHHIAIKDLKSLPKLRGSKYVQSEIKYSYQDVERELRQNRLVLFSGMPCQVAGLRHYLQIEYKNLICIDTICHSVPSPKVWKYFINETESHTHSKICSVNFRDKRDSWENYCLSFQLANGKECIFRKNNNPYMNAFISGLSIRPSCSQCIFKGINHQSDITLGDYWNVCNVQREAYNTRGTSLVIINTPRGISMLNLLRSALMLYPTSLNIALSFNPAYSKPSKLHPRRKLFFSNLDSLGAYQCIKVCLSPTKEEKMRAAIKQLAHRISKIIVKKHS